MFGASIQSTSRLMRVILRFAETRVGEVKRLQGPLGDEFGLRAGDLVSGSLSSLGGTLVILRVLPRDKAYR